MSDGQLCYSGYGFINFDSDQTAIIAMHRMGGKVTSVHLTWMSFTGTFIADHSQLQPASEVQAQPQFHSTGSRRGESCLARYVDVVILPGPVSQIDTSIWVGDLTPEVDDFALYRYFTTRYGTVRCAKVVLDESGFSKGYGFVRFGSEAEQQHALGSMTGEMGLGSKPIKVSMANQKNRVEGGGGLSPPPGGISSWGGVSAWPAQPSTATSGWPGPGGNPGAPQPAGHGGASWPGMGGVSSPGSGGSGPPAAATSPGPDYSAYHQYYQQYAA